MGHFAQVKDGIVQQVIVAEQDYISKLTSPSEWIQTSYNTYGGVHTNGGMPLRMNYAGIGFTYDQEKDAFYAPQPYQSWSLNNDTCIWEAPIARPNDGKLYKWDEDSLSWTEID